MIIINNQLGNAFNQVVIVFLIILDNVYIKRFIHSFFVNIFER